MGKQAKEVVSITIQPGIRGLKKTMGIASIKIRWN